MCDTIAVVRSGRVLFAKNSDRDANEAQLLEWQPRRRHAPHTTLRCTWLQIPQVAETHAVLLSRPFWMWGAEMGTNEHGVTIGNEAVFTREPVARTGLTGMDLLRLGLERAATAQGAVDVIVELLETHGQGGRCGHEDDSFAYHSSFLVADRGEAYVLETAGSHWAVDRVQGARAISNALSIPGFRDEYSDPLRTTVARARTRGERAMSLAGQARSARDLARILRDHGVRHRFPDYGWLTGALAGVCMHGGGAAVGSQTTASWLSELSADGCRHWATATAAPCTGLFKPVRVDEPLDLGRAPSDRSDQRSLWWRHEKLHRRVMRNPAKLLPLYAAERAATERAWLATPPSSAQAFAEGDRLLDRWLARLATVPCRDVRPPPTRWYWRRRNRRAGWS